MATGRVISDSRLVPLLMGPVGLIVIGFLAGLSLIRDGSERIRVLLLTLIIF